MDLKLLGGIVEGLRPDDGCAQLGEVRVAGDLDCAGHVRAAVRVVADIVTDRLVPAGYPRADAPVAERPAVEGFVFQLWI